MLDEQFADIIDRLLLEVQTNGTIDLHDGENEYGLLVSSIYDGLLNIA